MVRLYYRSLFDDLNELRQYADYLFQEFAEPARAKLLPAPGEKRVFPALMADFKVDVAKKDNEVIVTADMPAGVTKKNIMLDLIEPQSLEIRCERQEEKKEEKEGYYLKERRFGSMSRVVPLPEPVTKEGTTATFSNGVLEIHLKRSAKEPETKIAIQ